MRLFPALILLAACAGSDARVALNTPVIDTLPGGVVRVTNPGPTAWADTNGWKLVLEREIVPEEGTEGEVGSPRLVVADEGGTIYWLMQSPAVIKAYAPDGTWLRNIGREGDGPGEFRDGMFGISQGKLFIQDPNNTRLTVFDTTGTFVGSYPSQCCWWTSNFPVFQDGTIGIMGPPPPSQSEAAGALYLTRLDGTVIDTVIVPRTRDNPSDRWTVTLTNGGNVSRMVMGIPLQPYDLVRYRPDGTAIRGLTGAYVLAQVGLHGDTIRVFTAPAASIPVTDIQRDSIYDAVIDGMNEQWRESLRRETSVNDIPRTWPVWGEVATDPTGHTWVSRPNPAGGLGLIDVFSAEGVLLGTVPSPAKGIVGGYWTSSRVYLSGETDEGFPKVSVFRIERGEDGK